MNKYPRWRHRKPFGPAVFPAEAIPALAHPDARDYLHVRGLSDIEIEQYAIHYADGGPWRRRVLIPIFDKYGSMIAFQGRHIDGRDPRYRTEGPRPLYLPIMPMGRLVIVEGPFDVYSVQRVCPAAATLGNEPSHEQINDILSLVQAGRISQATIWYDNKAEREAIVLLGKLLPYVKTDIVLDTGTKDPGSCNPDTVRAILKQAR